MPVIEILAAVWVVGYVVGGGANAKLARSGCGPRRSGTHEETVIRVNRIPHNLSREATARQVISMNGMSGGDTFVGIEQFLTDTLSDYPVDYKGRKIENSNEFLNVIRNLISSEKDEIISMAKSFITYDGCTNDEIDTAVENSLEDLRLSVNKLTGGNSKRNRRKKRRKTKKNRRTHFSRGK